VMPLDDEIVAGPPDSAGVRNPSKSCSSAVHKQQD